jgi:amidophosphoribosyltransferase
MLDRIGPKKIVVVSSAPQIRFPDCYGIDMSRMSDFVAFRAVIALLKEQGKDYLLGEVYEQCLRSKAESHSKNYVKQLYAQYTDEEISQKISEIVRPPDMNAGVEVVFQTVDNLHKACPKHLGDWYFTGDYPTPGGMRVVNRSYANYMEGKLVRAY